MLDYKLHLLDELRIPQLSFELNIGDEILEQLKAQFVHFNNLIKLNCCDDSFKKITMATKGYLTTRVKSNAANKFLKKERSTRHSLREFNEVISTLDKGQRVIAISEDIIFDFAGNSRRNISQDINPYVLEIAKYQAHIRKINKQIYLESIHDLPKDKHAIIIRQLANHGTFKPIWFYADPQIVIEKWK